MTHLAEPDPDYIRTREADQPHGGVPADVTFSPHNAATVRALLATRSPTLNALDRQAA